MGGSSASGMPARVFSLPAEVEVEVSVAVLRLPYPHTSHHMPPSGRFGGFSFSASHFGHLYLKQEPVCPHISHRASSALEVFCASLVALHSGHWNMARKVRGLFRLLP
eukprot:CAMPEP_0206266988 /NCGR_PEP_ID=MMETSP0047_2-20121206/30895_1 /ASSEMBLY_ACC=CAM_ASM_000192 /TAXON_ID=195065 /ORGANISM="Chroomonas mesostigmatica_cf, Strain CCMP1168" /LENGTH=107 /DNA_ID=CAMNT_0053695133 /DNA_START=6 /DNA_END=325 /DNA_ORIENTATION=-